MSDFWWMHPGWKKALCGCCGENIWDSGGDPDHGVCFDCFFDVEYVRKAGEPRIREPEPVYICDICSGPGACADRNGYAVCSEACDHKAGEKPTRKPETKR